ncbi:MAG: hypothetical protein EA421_01600 [Gemmatimonadales bacterium]|nr:MAG: hypothetical protein EA421_01600 [Gemmatimonadales bacterium]
MLRMKWRLRTGGDHQGRGATTDGEVYRAGCPCVKRHVAETNARCLIGAVRRKEPGESPKRPYRLPLRLGTPAEDGEPWEAPGTPARRFRFLEVKAGSM